MEMKNFNRLKSIKMNNIIQKVTTKWDILSKIDDKYFNNCLGDLQSFSLYKSKKIKYSTEFLNNLWKNSLNNLKREKIFTSIYLHIPFCISKCAFCCYDSLVYNSESIKQYINILEYEINIYKKTFSSFEFDAFYIGGGTPNILKKKELEKIFNIIFSSFNIKEKGEKKIECNPVFITKEQLEIFKKYGFNKISYGVQAYDKDILKSINRGYQNEEHIINAINLAKKIEFDEINADLMLGLENDSNDKINLALTKLMKSRPNHIMLYKLKPTETYLKNFKIKNNKNDIFKKVYNLNKLFFDIKKKSKDHGYILNENSLNDSEADMGIPLSTKEYNDIKSENKKYDFNTNFPSSCLGLGLFSQSHIYKKILCQNKNLNFISDNKKNIYTGNKISLNLEVLSPLINFYYQYEYIPLKAFYEYLNKSFYEFNYNKINQLIILNKVIIDKDKLIIKNKNEIVKVFLFFLEKEDIKKIIYQKIFKVIKDGKK